MSYDRVLPKPPARYYDPSRRDVPTYTSTPLEHKIMSDGAALVNGPRENGHRSATLEIRPKQQIASNASPSMSPKKLPVTEVAAVLASPVPRKRPISVITSEASRQERSTSSSSSLSSSSGDSVLQFCLCQPEPKVPRPSNAFILYRQHYEAEVRGQNPGMPNPEISKIIGQMWRELAQELKQKWNDIAEEEKARHKQKYPEYKYRPRRSGRSRTAGNNIGSGTSKTPSGVSVCNRCGGRVINPPSTPTTPFTPATPASTQSDSSGPNSWTGPHPNDGKIFNHMQAHTGVDWREVVQNHLREETNPLYPDIKRRRFNGDGIYCPIRPDLTPDSPYSPQTPSFARPELSNPRSSYMRPPDRTSQQLAQDSNLTLAPLQTKFLSKENQCNVEAMVMTIPFINKIKILSMISPPFTPASTSRGAVISVEGQDGEAVQCVLRYLHDLFSENQHVREFKGPEPNSRQRTEGPDDTGGTTEQYLQYHRTISAWLNISGNITDFLSNNSVKEGSPSETSPGSIVPKTAEMHITIPNAAVPETTDKATTNPPENPFRIALISRYQLTTTDSHACTTPIKDSYAPMDHWQWMASLWRGCVGPDIIILIRDCEKEELERFGGGNPVENRLNDAKTLVIRRTAASSATIELKALRRVGFEVEEFLRK